MAMICSKHINIKIKVTKGGTQIVHMCCLWATVEIVTSSFSLGNNWFIKYYLMLPGQACNNLKNTLRFIMDAVL